MTIRVRGARVHYLADIDVDLPTGHLIAVTGPSGSGKTSLAFDTLYGEGRRRFLETLSAHARRYVAQLDRAPVDAVTGLPPAAAVGRQGVHASARSTAGTLSDTYGYLRLLFARIGTAHCLDCGTALTGRTPSETAAAVAGRYADRTVTLSAPLVEDHTGSRKQLFAAARARGFAHVLVDGLPVPCDPVPELDPTRRHTLELPLGDLRLDAGSRAALAALVDQAAALGAPAVVVRDGDEASRFDLGHGCSGCGAPFPAIGPRLFSFNAAHGACPACNGLGVEEAIDPDLLVADPRKSLRQGALVPTTPTGYIVYSQVTVDVMDTICRAHGFSADIPFADLTPEQRHVVFYGSRRLKVPFGKHSLESRLKWTGISAKPREEGYYKGMIPVMEETLKRNRNKNILRFARTRPCGACAGTRLRAEARAVMLPGLNRSIADLAALPFAALRPLLQSLPLDARDAARVAPLLAELDTRLGLLLQLGLTYLSMDRPSSALSGGEGRRMRLARELTAGLRGMLYVLDEPSTGLHARDKADLMRVLHALRDRGNTVVTVEHDPALLHACDRVLELGPGAGRHGGRLLFDGTPQELAWPGAGGASGRVLRGENPPPTSRGRAGDGPGLTVHGARAHNLNQVTVSFPLGCFNLVTGVSGAGKSTLVTDVLAAALRRLIHGADTQPGAHDAVTGWEPLERVIHLDAAPIGRTPRSNPATYTGLFDTVRALFAAQPEAVARGWDKGRFSMNTAGGRCEACGGAGETVVGMHGLPDVTVVCDTCGGARFECDTLAVRVHGRTIREVLDLTVDEAHAVFADTPAAARTLQALVDVGLGYLALGQSALTLSGGEAQRLKLARELARPTAGAALYLLDEPTAGLHPADVAVLLDALQRLVDAGHTVIAVEHHIDVIRAADYVVDLGPGSGHEGGRVVAAGPPNVVAACAMSATGATLCGTLPLPPARPPITDTPAPIRLEGVTTHNLRGIDVDIPVGRMTVITGLSGAGKSSLAFHTLFAESRRRFAASLSGQARRVLPRASGGEARAMHGLFPAVAVGRQTGGYGPHATVATMTDLSNHLRILFSRLGRTADGTALTARHFSFNHADGACPVCAGTGRRTEVATHLLITHPRRPLLDGAMAGHKPGRTHGDPHGRYAAVLQAAAAALNLDLSPAWAALAPEARDLALHGSGSRLFDVVWRFKRGARSGEHRFQEAWPGLCAILAEEHKRKQGKRGGADTEALMHYPACETCDGTRLNPISARVTVGGRSLPEVLALPVGDLDGYLHTLDHPAAREVAAACAPVLQGLRDVGLGYLQGDRRADDLSGGEGQRVRLAGCLGGDLVGVTYVLDEPTHGLHARDTGRLLRLLRDLTRRGNTVVVVEHDLDVIAAADHLIELGPGAGEDGGHVVAAGAVADLAACAASPTGRWLRGEAAMPQRRATRTDNGAVQVLGAYRHNLQAVDARFPLGALTVVAGVSGSGKSSLVFGTLAASADLGAPVHCRALTGLDQLDGVVRLDQRPPSGGGTPLTQLGLFDLVRTLYAATEDAAARGLTKAAFAYGAKQGACPACGGSGLETTGLDFLAQVVLPCAACEGKRFAPHVLEVTRHGRHIAAFLAMTVTQAIQATTDHADLAAGLAVLAEAGLGHLCLDREVRTLSSGEAMRLKLARCLWEGRRKPGRMLYLLDEPTTGLHLDDVAHLLRTLQRLTDAGHTLVVVEHHPAALAAADHLVVLGPEGGAAGGRLCYAGPPDTAPAET